MKQLLLALIRFYRKYLSGMKRMPTCRYIPTCSEYALEAVEKHGPLKGLLLAIWRILRCNPFSKGGYDPVPERFGPARPPLRGTSQGRSASPGEEGRA